MKVIFVAESERDAKFVRDNHGTIAEGLRGLMFWPSLGDFEVVAALRPPTQRELTALLEAMDAHPTPEELLELEYAALDDIATRDGRNGVYRP